MIPSVGRIVHLRLSTSCAETINKRRSDAQTAQAGQANSGFVVHTGNTVAAGDTYPLVITRVWSAYPDETTTVNGQLLLDGNDTYWCTSVRQGTEPGQWFEPPRVTAVTADGSPAAAQGAGVDPAADPPFNSPVASAGETSAVEPEPAASDAPTAEAGPVEGQAAETPAEPAAQESTPSEPQPEQPAPTEPQGDPAVPDPESSPVITDPDTGTEIHTDTPIQEG